MTELADWATLLALNAALWVLAWSLWRDTFIWTRLAKALTALIAANATTWTWLTLLRPFPWLADPYLMWGIRVLLITVSVWSIYEVRQRKKGNSTGTGGV